MKRTLKQHVCCTFFALIFLVPTALLSQERFEKIVIPNNLGVQLKSDTETAEHLDRVKSLGLKWVRRGFIWESIEKTKGVYDFERWDKFIKNCSDRGLSVIACMAFSNAIYGHAKDEPGTTAYANYAAALAERYKDYDVMWEIWNEPNTMTFWGKHGGVGNSDRYAEEYTNLVKVVVPAMKKANPNCIILAGSVSNMWSESYKWMGYCFGNHGMLDIDWDIWSVHPYGLKAPEDYIDAYSYSRGLMKSAGGKTDRLWINSERGFPVGKAEGWAGGDETLAYEYQAWHIVRQYLIDMLEGLPVTIWYEWGGTEGFALYEKAKHPTPAFNASEVLIKELGGYHLDKRINIKSQQDFILQFKNDEENIKLVVWTAPPKMQAPDKIVAHTVSLAVETTKNSFVTRDLYGVEGSLEVTEGTISVDLSGSPLYIELGKGSGASIAETLYDVVDVRFDTEMQSLSILSDIEIGKIALYNSLGNCVFQSINNAKETTVDIKDFPKGIYILNISDTKNNRIKTQKILK